MGSRDSRAASGSAGRSTGLGVAHRLSGEGPLLAGGATYELGHQRVERLEAGPEVAATGADALAGDHLDSGERLVPGHRRELQVHLELPADHRPAATKDDADGRQAEVDAHRSQRERASIIGEAEGAAIAQASQLGGHGHEGEIDRAQEGGRSDESRLALEGSRSGTSIRRDADRSARLVHLDTSSGVGVGATIGRTRPLKRTAETMAAEPKNETTRKMAERKAGTGFPGTTWASTATRLATPRTEPIWRAMLRMPLPVPKRAGGSDAAPAPSSEGMARPTAAPPRSWTGRRCDQ